MYFEPTVIVRNAMLGSTIHIQLHIMRKNWKNSTIERIAFRIKKCNFPKFFPIFFGFWLTMSVGHLLYSSEIRCLSLMKLPSEMLQNMQ